MNKRFFAVIAATLCSFCVQEVYAQENDDSDFGIIYSVGAEKKINKKLGADISFSGRTQDNSGHLERWTLGGSLNYKLYDTKRFDIKLNAGWEYMWQYNMPLFEYKECNLYDDVSDTYYRGLHEDNWNSTDRYWRNRHRTSLGISGSYKPNKRWSFSLRETVQYNHYCAVTDTIVTWKHRVKYNDDDEMYKTQVPEYKVKGSKDYFVLRSKIGAKYDIRHSIFSPYVSLDFGCGLNYSAFKQKYTAGTDIRISKHNSVDVFYRFQTENDDDEPAGHILGLGYNFKF